MSADLEIDAAEYVLGTLDHDERLAFAGLLADDPNARKAVAAWKRRLAGLSDTIEPIAPPQGVWAAIERALGRAAAAAPHLKVIHGGIPAGDAPDLRASLQRWRRIAIAASSLAAALLVFVGIREYGPGAEQGSTYVAAINPGGGKPAMLVRVDLKTKSVVVRPVSAEAPTGKALELWYIGDGKPPRSMGVVKPEAVSLKIPADVRSDDTAASTGVFAVSVEPPGGSKTGAPTGPVVYSGALIKE
jgi:anti-sigma-K factor RskA